MSVVRNISSDFKEKEVSPLRQGTISVGCLTYGLTPVGNSLLELLAPPACTRLIDSSLQVFTNAKLALGAAPHNHRGLMTLTALLK